MVSQEEFTFIDAGARPGEMKRYDVYRASGGPQLGHVAQLRDRVWAAVDGDTRDQVRRRSRHLATVGLWGVL